MNVKLPCPSREQLERLLLGAMPAEEMEALQGHVSTCSVCLESIREATTEDPLVLAVRAGGRAEKLIPDDADPTLLARLRRLHPEAKATASLSVQTLVQEPDRVEGLYRLLTPPQEPDELGRFGPYGILRSLGSGGMGVVFAARQLQPRRIVALKMILVGWPGSKQRLTRFRRETEIIAQLQHPNIVPVYEVGEYADRPYYSMEYLEGGSLAKRLAAAPLAPRTAAEFVLVLARAAHFAHERGIVHRDLKPANVLLAADGTAKIADFGLAKQRDSEPAEQTRSGAILGTPGYMAPEQTEGGKEVGPAADVYALGAILYECLTGRPPFRAANVLETLEQVRSQEPAPISRLQPKTPRDLQTICLACLHKEPSRRYGSAAALADDLGRFLHGEPIQARPVSIRERLWKWVRRKPILAGLLTVTGLSLAALIASSLMYNARLTAAVQRAETKEAEARQQHELAATNYRAARDALNRMLERLEQRRLGEVPQLKELQRDQRQDALIFYQAILAGADDPDPEIRLDAARACERAATIQELLGRTSDAAANYRRAIELIETLPPPQRDLFSTQCLLASCYGCLGQCGPHNLTDAQRHLGAARAIAERLMQAQPDNPELQEELARIEHQLAHCYLNAQRKADAEPHCLRALELRTALVRDHPNKQAYVEALAEDYLSVGVLYATTGRGDKAVAAYTKIEELLRSLLARDPNDVRAPLTLSLTYVNWGYNRLYNGRPEAALKRANQAVELADAVQRREPAYDRARVASYSAHGFRAQIQDALGRWADALKDWDVTIALARAQDQLVNRTLRAVDVARMGDHRGAAAEARAVAETPGATDDIRYNAACVYARAIQPARADKLLSPSERDAAAERYAAEAIAVLGRLKAAGYFQSAERLKLLRTDPDLQPLRERSDFQKLLPKEKTKPRP